jgi:hypothetical protein
MQCPKCRLISPPGAERCDCGYSFVTRTVDRPAPGLEGIARAARILWLLGGLQVASIVLGVAAAAGGAGAPWVVVATAARVVGASSGLALLGQTAQVVMRLRDGPQRGRAPSPWLVPLMVLPFVNLVALVLVEKTLGALLRENGGPSAQPAMDS